MTKKLNSLLLASLVMFTSQVFAVDSALITQMTKEDPAQIRAASKKIINTHEMDVETLDTLAEVLLQNADKGKSYVDGLAWATKALAASENPRYSTVLSDVAANDKVHKKLRKYAKKAAKQVGKPKDVEQYKAGSVDLASVTAAVQKADAARRKELVKNMKVPDGLEAISIVTENMPQDEVLSRCGPPTSTTSYITGKAFIPFNFKGGDAARIAMLYKGQGTVVVSANNRYTATLTVRKVIIDPTEKGFR